MKKIIAFFLAVVYLVFTTFTLWQVNDDDSRSFHAASDFHKTTIATYNDGLEKAINFDILVAKSFSKAPKHLSVSGKIKIPRASSCGPDSRHFLSFSTAGYYNPNISMTTPLLYHAAIYLKNGVLRI